MFYSQLFQHWAIGESTAARRMQLKSYLKKNDVLNW